jgi:uncharacterized protein DUF6916
MPDVGELTLETFAPHVGEPFTIHMDDGVGVDVVLSEAIALSDTPSPSGRVPFSIMFRGPTDKVLAQRIYRVEHAQLGTCELFLVPLGPDAEGSRFEAVFS